MNGYRHPYLPAGPSPQFPAGFPFKSENGSASTLNYNKVSSRLEPEPPRHPHLKDKPLKKEPQPTPLPTIKTEAPAPTDDDLDGDLAGAKGKRGRPRKHAPKIPLPPLYVFIRNLLHNPSYNPSVITWVDESIGCFKVTSTTEFAKIWGRMKSNRSEEMNYEKMSRAMRYHYGSERNGRKGHLAMVKEKRLFYRFGELAVNWRQSEVTQKSCTNHDMCKNQFCLWSKE